VSYQLFLYFWFYPLRLHWSWFERRQLLLSLPLSLSRTALEFRCEFVSPLLLSLSSLSLSLSLRVFDRAKMSLSTAALLCLSLFAVAAVAEDPYRFFNWNVTYGDIYPLGVRQQVLFSSYTSLLLCCLGGSHSYHTHTGNTYQRSIPRSRHSFCYQRQPHHQCLQQLGPALSLILVHSPLIIITYYASFHSKHLDVCFLTSTQSVATFVSNSTCLNASIQISSVYKNIYTTKQLTVLFLFIYVFQYILNSIKLTLPCSNTT